MSATPLYPDPSELSQKPYPPSYDAGMQGGGAAPPPGFYQPPVQTAPVLMVEQTQPQQVVIVGHPSLGTHNARMTCPNCRSDIKSSIEKKPGIVAWISAGVCCLVGCWLGCCLIPLCVDPCMDTDHSCPNCRIKLGSHRAF